MVDDVGNSPLDLAMCWDNDDVDVGVDIALYLVNHGCGDDKDKVKLLCRACNQNKLDIVKEIIEKHKVDPKSEIIITLYTHSLVCSYSYIQGRNE